MTPCLCYILNTSHDVSIHQRYSKFLVEGMLNSSHISCGIMVRNKAMLCITAAIYKCLQILLHNYITGQNEYFIFTSVQSTVRLTHTLPFFV